MQEKERGARDGGDADGVGYSVYDCGSGCEGLYLCVLSLNMKGRYRKMSKIKDLDEMSRCDECKHVFKGKDTMLVEPAKNIKMMPFHARIIGVDKDGIITSLSEPLQKGDKVLACPACHRVHLFGFDVAMDASDNS